ncbi:hypothetical protein M8C21_022620, partial [Ambrosia artemisiifolia]
LKGIENYTLERIVWVQKIQTKDCLQQTFSFPCPCFPSNTDEPTEPEIDAVGSPIIAISQGKNKHYMDYIPGLEDVSLENVRESLIAISYCEPERVSCVTEHEVLNHENNNVVVVSEETAIIDESRSKLMSIAASPTMDCND